MVSKVCSRSQGHPPGPRNRAMIETARSNRSPVVGIKTNLNEERRKTKRRNYRILWRESLRRVGNVHLAQSQHEALGCAAGFEKLGQTHLLNAKAKRLQAVS